MRPAVSGKCPPHTRPAGFRLSFDVICADPGHVLHLTEPQPPSREIRGVLTMSAVCDEGEPRSQGRC